ncbi:hypothetical protein BC830DRAFT_411813 [Chytriomyces sp. MP71]|nr:hypothetical protein BC830DRAFT_411813 [Chytriomyces sp. MP71]
MSYKRVYVGKLPRDVTEKELRRLFDEFGRIKEIRVLVGFAFVEYDDARDARDAVEKLDNSRFLGERITVEPSKVQRDDRDRDRDRRRDDRGADKGDRYEPRGGSGTARGSGKNRLKIENLPSRISWQTLKDLMRKAGEVTFADVDRDGYGIVEFASVDDMQQAIKMYDDDEYEGRRLIVKEDRSSSSSSSRRDDRDDRRTDRRRDRDERSRSPEPRSSRRRSASPAPRDAEEEEEQKRAMEDVVENDAVDNSDDVREERDGAGDRRRGEEREGDDE